MKKLNHTEADCPNGYDGENMKCCRCVKPIKPNVKPKLIDLKKMKRLAKAFEAGEECGCTDQVKICSKHAIAISTPTEEGDKEEPLCIKKWCTCNDKWVGENHPKNECVVHAQTDKGGGWAEGFNKKSFSTSFEPYPTDGWSFHCGKCEENVKSFIQETLASQKSQIVEELEKIDLVEGCKPDCTPVEHAYHEGTWASHLKLEDAIQKISGGER